MRLRKLFFIRSRIFAPNPISCSYHYYAYSLWPSRKVTKNSPHIVPLMPHNTTLLRELNINFNTARNVSKGGHHASKTRHIALSTQVIIHKHTPKQLNFSNAQFSQLRGNTFYSSMTIAAILRRYNPASKDLIQLVHSITVLSICHEGMLAFQERYRIKLPTQNKIFIH